MERRPCQYIGQALDHSIACGDVISGIGEPGLMRWSVIKPNFVEIDRRSTDRRSKHYSPSTKFKMVKQKTCRISKESS